jgi:hypothetical protein
VTEEVDAGRRVIEDLVSKFQALTSETPADPSVATDPGHEAPIVGVIPDPA